MTGRALVNVRRALNVALACAILPIVALFVVREYGPVKFEDVSIISWGFVAVGAVPTVLAWLVAHLVPVPAAQRTIERSQASYLIMDRWTRVGLFFSSALYIALSLYDLITLGGLFDKGPTHVRYDAIAIGPRNSVLGFMEATLAGAPVIFLASALHEFQRTKRQPIVWIALLVAAISAVITFGSGGRNPFFISVLYLFIFWKLSRISISGGWRARPFKPGTPGRKGRLLAVYGLVVGGFIASLLIFAQRADMRHGDPEQALAHLESAYSVSIHKPELVSTTTGWGYLSLTYLAYYVGHSLNALQTQISEAGCGPTYGGVTFYNFLRALDAAFATDVGQAAADALAIPGLYYSLPGTLYVDFCGFGLLVYVILVGIAAMAASVAVATRLRWLFVATFLLTAVAFAPWYSVFTTGNGSSVLIWAVVAGLMVQQAPCTQSDSRGRIV